VAEGVENLARSSAAERAQCVGELLVRLHYFGAFGVVIDWEEIDPGLGEELTGLVAESATELTRAGFETWLCVGMDEGLESAGFSFRGAVG